VGQQGQQGEWQAQDLAGIQGHLLCVLKAKGAVSKGVEQKTN
jgi:hypothetical protein